MSGCAGTPCNRSTTRVIPERSWDEELNNFVSTSVTGSPPCFSNSAGILSKPAALFFFSLCMALLFSRDLKVLQWCLYWFKLLLIVKAELFIKHRLVENLVKMFHPTCPLFFLCEQDCTIFTSDWCIGSFLSSSELKPALLARNSNISAA